LRLTPSAQSRAGWLLNEYGISSNDWEMEVSMSIRSDFYIGGDGFAIWVLDHANVEMYEEHVVRHAVDMNLENLERSVMGMKEDFSGFGVVFDTYDNNADRSNPTVCVLKNDGTHKEWDHDGDFEKDRIKESFKKFDTKCTLEYRNVHPDPRVMLRYQNGYLHVYVDEGGKEIRGDYKACLAVHLNISTIDTHNFAITAITGAVADIHEITGITVRYLDEDDPELDDWAFARQGSGLKYTWPTYLHWTLCAIAGAYLVWVAYQDYRVFQRNIKKNTALLCSMINASRKRSSKVCFVLYAWLVITGSYMAVVLGTPKFLIHTWEYMTSYQLDPSAISKLNRKNKGKDPLTYLYVELASTILSLIYFLLCFIFHFDEEF